MLIFEKLFSEAGGLIWPDKNKIGALKVALHLALRDAFATVKPPASYDEYVSELMGVLLRKEAAKTAFTAWYPFAPNNVAQTLQDPNTMDWEPFINAAAIEQENKGLRGKKAKWVIKEEIQRRKAEKRCLCCSRKGCSTRKCPLLLAVKPASVNTAAVEKED